jgi:hypothetical protein
MSLRNLMEAENALLWVDEVRLAIGNTIVGRAVTTDATTTTLLSISLLPSRTTFLRAQVIARRTGGSGGSAEDGAAYLFVAAYKMVSGTATLIGSVNALHTAEDQAGWAATFTVSGGSVLLRVTGAADNNVSWNGKVHVESIEQ